MRERCVALSAHAFSLDSDTAFLTHCGFSADPRPPQLLLIHAAATALGGGGATFSAVTVLESYEEVEKIRRQVLTWLPE